MKLLKKIFIYILFPTLSLLFLTACVPKTDVIQMENFESEIIGKSAIGISITTKGISSLHNLSFQLKNLETSESKWITVYSSFKDDYYEMQKKGKFVVLALLPGSYELTSWGARAVIRGKIGDLSPIEENSISFKFTAEPGDIKYVGNLHMIAAGISNLEEKKGKFKANFEVRDNRKKDIKEFKKALPENKHSSIKIQLMKH